MTTALEKVRTLVLGNLHDLLDATIDLNSMGAIRQHIRDLEAAKEKIADQAAIAKGRVASLQREIADLEIKSKTTDENVDLLLNDTDPTNDHLAEALEARLISYEEALTQKREELVAQSEAANALADATARLTAKHQEMLANLRRLESVEQTRLAAIAKGVLPCAEEMLWGSWKFDWRFASADKYTSMLSISSTSNSCVLLKPAAASIGPCAYRQAACGLNPDSRRWYRSPMSFTILPRSARPV